MLTEKIIFIFIFFGLAFDEEWFMGLNAPVFAFHKLLSVICYLLFVMLETQKIVLGNCQL